MGNENAKGFGVEGLFHMPGANKDCSFLDNDMGC
jgi:hypothetical protein